MHQSPVESQIAFRESIVLGRAGKATGKSKYWYSVQKDERWLNGKEALATSYGD